MKIKQGKEKEKKKEEKSLYTTVMKQAPFWKRFNRTVVKKTALA